MPFAGPGDESPANYAESLGNILTLDLIRTLRPQRGRGSSPRVSSVSLFFFFCGLHFV